MVKKHCTFITLHITKLTSFIIFFFPLSFIAFLSLSLFPFLLHSSPSHEKYGLQYKQQKTYMSNLKIISFFYFFELGDEGKKEAALSITQYVANKKKMTPWMIIDQLGPNLCECKCRTFKRDGFLAFYGY